MHLKSKIDCAILASLDIFLQIASAAVFLSIFSKVSLNLSLLGRTVFSFPLLFLYHIFLLLTDLMSLFMCDVSSPNSTCTMGSSRGLVGVRFERLGCCLHLLGYYRGSGKRLSGA